MKTHAPTLPFAAFAFALALAGCTTDSDAAPPANPTEPAPAVGEIDVPTEAQAEKQAAEQITPENADAEFEKLMEEIQGDTGGQ